MWSKLGTLIRLVLSPNVTVMLDLDIEIRPSLSLVVAPPRVTIIGFSCEPSGLIPTRPMYTSSPLLIWEFISVVSWSCSANSRAYTTSLIGGRSIPSSSMQLSAISPNFFKHSGTTSSLRFWSMIQSRSSFR